MDTGGQGCRQAERRVGGFVEAMEMTSGLLLNEFWSAIQHFRMIKMCVPAIGGSHYLASKVVVFRICGKEGISESQILV